MGSAMARGWLGDLDAAGIARLSVVEPHPGEDVVAAADDAAIVREAISLLSPAERAALMMWEF